jgi:hypothetical protein
LRRKDVKVPGLDGAIGLHDRLTRNVQLENRLYARCDAAEIVNSKQISEAPCQ